MNTALKFSEKDVKVLIIGFVLILIARGLWYINFDAMCLDDYSPMSASKITSISLREFWRWASEGRLFYFVPYLFFMAADTSMSYVYFVGFILMSIQMVLGGIWTFNFFSDNRGEIIDKVLFVTIFSMFPYLIEVSIYKYTTCYHGFSFAVLTASLGGIFIFNKSVYLRMIGCFLIFYTLNIYQPFIYITLTILVGKNILNYISTEYWIKLKQSMILLVSTFVFYYIVSIKLTGYVFKRIVNADTRISDAGISITTAFERIPSVPKMFYNFFINEHALSSPTLCVLLISLILIFLYTVIKELWYSQKKWHRRFIHVCLIVSLIYIPFFLNIGLSGRNPFVLARIYSFAGMIFSFIFLYSLLRNKKSKFLFLIRTIGIGVAFLYLLFNQSAFVNQLKVSEKDTILANKIINKMEEIDDFSTKKLVILGRTSANSSLIVKHRLVGQSVFENADARRISNMFSYLSSYSYTWSRDRAKNLQLKTKYKDLPSWPDKRSLFEDEEGYIILKLGN